MLDIQYNFYTIVQHKMIINGVLLKANNVPCMHTEIGPSSFSFKMKYLCTEYARSSYLRALRDLPTPSLPTFITGHTFTVGLTCRRHEPLAIPQICCLSGLRVCRSTILFTLTLPLPLFYFVEFYTPFKFKLK